MKLKIEQLEKNKSIIKNKSINKDELVVTNGFINAYIGSQANEINVFSIKLLALSFCKKIQELNLSRFLVIFDKNNFESKYYGDIFSSVLNKKNITVNYIESDFDLNYSLMSYICENNDVKYDGFIHFKVNSIDKKININFFEKDGNPISFNISKKRIDKSSDLLPTMQLDIEPIKFMNFDNLIEQYFKKITNNSNLSNLHVSFGNNFGMNKINFEIFSKNLNLKSKILNSSNKRVKRNTTTRNAQMKNIFLSTDILINYWNTNNNFEFIVKHKKRFKFLTFNDLGQIYLFYLMQNKPDFIENKEIIITKKSNESFLHMVKNSNTKVVSVDNHIDDFSAIEQKQNFLFYIDSENETFLNNNSHSLFNDGFSNIKLFLELASFYKKQGKNLFEILEEIRENNNSYRYSIHEENLPFEKAHNFFDSINKLKKIDDYNIKRIQKENDSSLSVKIFLDNNINIYFNYDPKEEKMKTIFSIFNFKQNEKYLDLVVKEKKIQTFLNEFKEDLSVKQISKKGIIKYFFLISIFGIMLWFIFNNILDSSGSFNDINQLLKSEPVLLGLLPLAVFSVIITLAGNAVLTWRILSILGYKAKFRHLLTSQLIGTCVSQITPLMFGGEGFGYWYMRRKGHPRAPLVAAFLVQSLFVQLSIVLFSLIFVPMGFVKFYPMLLNNSNTWSLNLLSVLIPIGVVFDMFSALMIALLTFSKRVQIFIVSSLTLFVEWLPFVVTRDYSLKGAQIQNEFSSINKAAKQIFNSSGTMIGGAFIFVELLSYKFIPSFIDVGSIIYFGGNMIVDNGNPFLSYLDILSVNSLVRGANAVNFLPSGMGVSDLGVVALYKYLFIGSPDTFKTPQVFQTLARIVYTVCPIVLSFLMLFTVQIGESRVDKYNRAQRILKFNDKNLSKYKTKTTFYGKISIFWITSLVLILTTYYLVAFLLF